MTEASSGRDVQLAYAVGPNGRMVSIDDVPNGLACGCRCPECSRRLVAKKGDVRAFHFAHEGDGSCQGAYESMVHRLAKDIIADDCGLTVPRVDARYKNEERTVFAEQWFPVDNVRLEVWRDGIRPDIIVNRMCPRQGEKRELAVEIYVTHRVDDEKLAAIRARGLATIEIDLSDIPRDIERCHLEPMVRQSASRCWLFNPKQAEYNEALRLEVEAEERAEREDVVKKKIRDVVSSIAPGGQRKLPAWDVYRETDIPGVGRIGDICREGGPSFGRFLGSLNSIAWMWCWRDKVLPEGCVISEGDVELYESWNQPTERLCLGLRPLKDAFERQKVLRKRTAIRKRVELDRMLELERLSLERARREAQEKERRRLADQAEKERIAREREAAWKKDNADRIAAEERDREAKERARDARLVDVRSKILSEAYGRLGADRAAKWLKRVNLHELAAAHDSGQPYTHAISDEIAALARDAQRAKAVAERARLYDDNQTKLSRLAARKLGSLDRAGLWLRTTNPKLNHQRPIEVCDDPEWMSRCVALLQ